jgi:hypothetical protein
LIDHRPLGPDRLRNADFANYLAATLPASFNTRKPKPSELLILARLFHLLTEYRFPYNVPVIEAAAAHDFQACDVLWLDANGNVYGNNICAYGEVWEITL